VSPAIYVLVFGILAVFGHSGLQGEHGYAALREAQALEIDLAAELETTRRERAEMQNLVARLRDDNLDLDLLDERARAALGYVRQEDLIIR
jgi:cell division protein FtsB